jgi:hypothetical protein
MRERVYALTDLDSGRADSLKVDGWLKRSIVEVSALVDTIPQFWDSLAPLEKRSSTSVTAESFISAVPSDAIRLHPSIRIGPRMARLLIGGSRQDMVKDEFHQPTEESPEVSVMARPVDSNGDAVRGSNYHVYPETFSNQSVTIRYIKEADGTESFSDRVAEAFALKAAEIGLIELREVGKAGDMNTRYKEHITSISSSMA